MSGILAELDDDEAGVRTPVRRPFLSSLGGPRFELGRPTVGECWRRSGRRARGDTLHSVFLFGALALFIAEVAAFVAVGMHIGFGWAVLLLLGVSVLGPLMIRRVGIGVLTRTQHRLAVGEMPTRELLDGVVVLFGGALICLPGFITDAIGLLLMVGPVRRLFIRATGRHVARRLQAMSPSRWRVINVSPDTHRQPWDPAQGPREVLGSGARPDAEQAYR